MVVDEIIPVFGTFSAITALLVKKKHWLSVGEIKQRGLCPLFHWSIYSTRHPPPASFFRSIMTSWSLSFNVNACYLTSAEIINAAIFLGMIVYRFERWAQRFRSLKWRGHGSRLHRSIYRNLSNWFCLQVWENAASEISPWKKKT